jgi:hypothetical protein
VSKGGVSFGRCYFRTAAHRRSLGRLFGFFLLLSCSTTSIHHFQHKAYSPTWEIKYSFHLTYLYGRFVVKILCVDFYNGFGMRENTTNKLNKTTRTERSQLLFFSLWTDYRPKECCRGPWAEGFVCNEHLQSCVIFWRHRGPRRIGYKSFRTANCNLPCPAFLLGSTVIPLQLVSDLISLTPTPRVFFCELHNTPETLTTHTHSSLWIHARMTLPLGVSLKTVPVNLQD